MELCACTKAQEALTSVTHEDVAGKGPRGIRMCVVMRERGARSST